MPTLDHHDQVLASYTLWRSGGQEQPWKFGETRVVAVDECSMVGAVVVVV